MRLFLLLCLLEVVPSAVFAGEKRDSDDESDELASGTTVRRGAFPNVAAILRDGRQICGGTLIDSNHILTAANCVSFLNVADIPKLTIYLNTVALKTFNPGAIISKVVGIKYHERYNKITHENDIALLKLDTTITTLYPLSQPAYLTSDTYVGTNGTILRWGSAKIGSKTQKVLLQASVTVIPNAECSESYQQYIFNSSLCAASNAIGEGACQDDSSGGPIIVNGRQVGITSWSKGCMDSKFPGVYTRVTAYQDWINYNLAAM